MTIVMNCLNSLEISLEKIKSPIQQYHLMFTKKTCSHTPTQNLNML